MNDQIEGRISRHLHNQAPLINVGAPSVIAVTRRAAQRRIRRRAAVGVMSTAAVSAGTIFGIQALSRTQTHRLRPAGTPTEQSPGGGIGRLTAVDPSLVWNTVEPDSTKALGSTALMTSTADGFIAWSTQPGRSNDFAPKLYRSTDGVNWTVAGDAPNTGNAHQFTSDGKRLFSFATTAAPAPVNGSRFGLEVGASDDAGATWQPTELPVDLGDLSGLHGKVEAYVTPLSIAAGSKGVLAVVGVQPRFAPEVERQLGGGINGVTAEGVLRANSCVGEATTIVVGAAGGGLPDGTYPAMSGQSVHTTPADTALAGTVPGDVTTTELTGAAITGAAATSTTVTGIAPGETAPAGTDSVGTARVGAVTDSTVPVTDGTTPACDTSATAPATPAVVAWSDLGIDPATAAIFGGAPRLFLSGDGTTFTPVAFPDVAPGGQVVGVNSIATADGFALTVSTIAAGTARGGVESRLFTSTDGSTWVSYDIASLYVSSLGRLADGAIGVVGTDVDGSPIASVLRDGVVRSTGLNGLLGPADGRSARMSVQQSAVGPTGFTMVASVFRDSVVEAGGVSITRDGVTMTIEDGNGTASFVDAATGEVLGRLSPTSGPTGQVHQQPQNADGTLDYAIAAADGSTRTTFTGMEVQQHLAQVYAERQSLTPSTLVLHSDDGLDWSREDLDAIAGFPAYGVMRVQSTSTSVLITLVKQPLAATDGTVSGTAPADTAPAPTVPTPGAPGSDAQIPQTVVLVGTRKA
ncbi:MAG: hypothetical protein ABIR68_00520 [Ilumatobacteraceae bacterium]